jgi:hypothetical protein
MEKRKLLDRPWKLLVAIILEGVAAGAGAWITVVSHPFNVALYSAMLILFLFAGGITVVVYASVTKNTNFYVLGFAFLLLAVFVVIDRYEGFAVKISAFATLILAFAAFAAIYVSIDEGRRTRQRSMERESRDRKERLIDEVAKWLKDLEGHISPASRTLISKISQMEDRLKGSREVSFEQWLKVDDLDTAIAELGNIVDATNEAEYYEKLTLQFDEGLSKLIGVVTSEVKERGNLRVEHVTYIKNHWGKRNEGASAAELPKDDDRSSEGSRPDEEAIINGKLVRNARALRESIEKAIEKTIELKVRLISIS